LKPYLVNIYSSEEISTYKIEGPYSGNIKRFIFSTPETRNILNHPEIVGHTFRKMMGSSLVKLFKHFPDPEVLEGLEDSKSNILCFLRGGLNFSISDALGEAYGFQMQTTSYMTSQRAKDEFGRWFIKDAQYQKFVFEDNSTIFCGDIIATGSTIKNGLEVLFANAKNSGKRIKNFIFITIGCHKIEKILEDFLYKLKDSFSNFGNVVVIYMEGKFHLADSKDEVMLKVQGTDLMRREALMAPEFLLSQFSDISPILERCVIYDGGSRSFNVQEYCDEIIKYWFQVKRLSNRGISLYDMQMRDFQNQQSQKKISWSFCKGFTKIQI